MIPPAEFAPAKVNLSLAVTGRRPDGYHRLDSLVVFAGIGDHVTAEPADTLSLTIIGPFGENLSATEDNLVLKAARGLADLAGIDAGAHLTLTKNLPVASGIGGGSADAAATLRLLCRLWDIRPRLDALALQLGADVPVCLAGRPAHMSGIGEILAPVPDLPSCGLLLVNPGVGVATAAIFKARTGPFSSRMRLPPQWPSLGALTADLAGTCNDLQAPAIALCPVIAEVLAAIEATPGCRFARMSGSGATCFGLYESVDAAEFAAAAVGHPGWWRWGGGLHP